MIKQAEVSGSATVDGTGQATVVLNAPPGTTLISSVAVIVTGSAAIPTCTMYAGPVVVPGRIMATLRAGDRGTFRGDAADKFRGGQQITLQWTLATPGAACQAVLRGETSIR